MVWSDLTNLFGGDVFWDEIEDAIRKHTVKFLPLVSEQSQLSHGVQDEIDVAIKVQRHEGIARFIIPLRVDSIPYETFRANIGRKNAIDFSTDWASGFQELIEVLENDSVPKDEGVSAQVVMDWLVETRAAQFELSYDDQELTSNWLELLTLPEWLHFSRVSTNYSLAQSLLAELPFPAFYLNGMYVSFARQKDLQPGMPIWFGLTHAHSVRTEDFLNGDVEFLPNVMPLDASRMISGLVRLAWERMMQKKGLQSFDMSKHASAWYYPSTHPGVGRVTFKDLDGRDRWRALVGQSKKRNAHWHYALSIRPAIGRTSKLILQSHIIFTRDGTIPVHSAKHMHRLRRGFCRSWWNDKWRTLLLAYISSLVGDGDTIDLGVAPDCSIVVDSAPIMFISPVSLRLNPVIDDQILDEVKPSVDDEDLDALIEDLDSDLIPNSRDIERDQTGRTE